MIPTFLEALKVIASAIAGALLDHFAGGSEDPAKTDDK
jgi:hypothetical protein